MSDIVYLDNQPVQLYKVNPSMEELELGYTSWELSAYHKKLGICGFVGPDYFHPVLNTDYLTFQFKAATGADIFQPYFETIVSSGLATSTSANHLVDITASFVTAGVAIDQMVVNTTTGNTTTIANINSATNLTLNNDYFTSGDDYYISFVSYTGNWIYDYLTGLISMPSAGAGDVEAPALLTINKWYKVTINVTNISAGDLQIKLGNTIAGTINTLGEHTIYGQCISVTDFQIINSADFVGEFDLGSLAIYEMVMDYNIVLFDRKTEEFVNYLPFDATWDNSLSIGNVFISIPWLHFAMECGNYVIGVTDLIICDGDIVRNGDFSSSVGWALDPGVTIAGGKLLFTSATSGNAAVNNGTCTISEGQDYILQFTINTNSGTQTGIFHIEVGGFTVYTHNAATMASPTTVTIPLTSLGVSNFTSIVADTTCTFSIDNFSVTATPTADINTMDGLSECLCVCDEQDCSMVIEYSGTQPTFGEFFDSNNTKMRIRIPGRLRNSKTPTIDFDPFKSTLDNEVQPYNNLMRSHELATELVPEWVHNSLAVILMHSLVWIDGTSCKTTTAYDANWGDSEVAHGLAIIVKTNQNNLRNTY